MSCIHHYNTRHPSSAPQVPTTSVVGNYQLRVEGNYPGTVGGTLFLNETSVQFSTRFLTILVQTSRPVYNGDQKGTGINSDQKVTGISTEVSGDQKGSAIQWDLKGTGLNDDQTGTGGDSDWGMRVGKAWRILCGSESEIMIRDWIRL